MDDRIDRQMVENRMPISHLAKAGATKRTSLIRFCTVCLDFSVPYLRNFKVIKTPAKNMPPTNEAKEYIQYLMQSIMPG